MDITFPAIVHIAEEVGEGMKEKLVATENEETGRVPLSNFCRQSLDEGWQSNESRGYHRHQRALDETDPRRPAVINPKYLCERSNCIASTICSIDRSEESLYVWRPRLVLIKPHFTLLHNLYCGKWIMNYQKTRMEDWTTGLCAMHCIASLSNNMVSM